ncbi:MAG: hypothetical protein LLH30_18995 [Candidatus Manganitrophus sp. SA1]|nr:hypothetical protein [Candidatus Manganitrophus morganii]
MKEDACDQLLQGCLPRLHLQWPVFGRSAGGFASGSTAILWKHAISPRFSTPAIQILATDAEPEMIARAERGYYPASSLKALPKDWRREAFVPSGEAFCIKPTYREPVTFLLRDIRNGPPEGGLWVGDVVETVRIYRKKFEQ